VNTPNENVSMALFCDFENVALGVRDTRYQKFDIRPVLERLLLKGSIVVKKAYCDWERYKEFKAPMHEANFELIEIPHVRQSGKNSADIRLVVDALDLCYTKSHVNTFVIISGDSDFSPLVSKLRENDKKVIGVGVKQSTSDLLIANCDEFIFYDDLAREGQRAAESRRDSRDSRGAGGGQRRTPEEERRRKEEQEARKTQAVELVVETFDALMAERGDGDRIWASVLKDALKRRKPDFNESYYGFRAFGNLLEEAQSRGFLDVGREEKSGTYVYRDSAHGRPAPRQGVRAAALQPADEAVAAATQEASAEPAQGAARGSRGGQQEGTKGRSGRDRKRGGRRDAERAQDDGATDGDREPAQDAARAAAPVLPWEDAESWEGEQAQAGDESRASAGFASTRSSQAAPDLRSDAAAHAQDDSQATQDGSADADTPAAVQATAKPAAKRAAKTPRRAAGRGKAAKTATGDTMAADDGATGDKAGGAAPAPAATADAPAPDEAKPARKTAARPRRPRKTAASSDA
jgi:uncharacterized LabA/DUF88 family protein